MTAATCIVVGAGPAGLAAALALRQAGLDPVVYERRCELAEVGSGLTLWPNAMRALEAIGVAAAVRQIGAPAWGIEIRAASGRVLDATGPDLMRRRFNAGGVALHRAELQRVLADRLGSGSIRLGAGVAAVREDVVGPTAMLDDGSAVRAHLLVGADGIRSSVRGAILGEVSLRYAGYIVWRAIAPFAIPGGTGCLTMGRGAQFGVFPMTGDRAYWFAALNLPEGETADRDRLLETFAGWHRPVPDVLLATPAQALVATPIYDASPFPRRVAGRIALVGDAAHPATPALGQGACQAIEDAVVLGRALARRGVTGAPAIELLPDALVEYERRRVRRTNAMTRQARQMGAVGQWENRAACWLRDRIIASMPRRLRLRQLEWMFSFEL